MIDALVEAGHPVKVCCRVLGDSSGRRCDQQASFIRRGCVMLAGHLRQTDRLCVSTRCTTRWGLHTFIRCFRRAR